MVLELKDVPALLVRSSTVKSVSIKQKNVASLVSPQQRLPRRPRPAVYQARVAPGT